MNPPASETVLLWPLLAYAAGVVSIAAGMIGLSFALGQRHNERATGIPYESGVIATGSARVRLSSDFFLIAILFVIFDLESVFIYAWAVAARDLGWFGYAQICIFVAVLLAALGYLWRERALEM